MNNSSEDMGDDIVYKIRETLRTLPTEITNLVNKGAQLEVQKQIIMSISVILQGEMLKMSEKFGKLLELRAKVIKFSKA